jgi:hypothetical protein
MDNSTRRIENINSLNKLRIDIVTDKQTDAFLTKTKGQVLLQISARLIDHELKTQSYHFLLMIIFIRQIILEIQVITQN